MPPLLPLELRRYADNEKICHGKVLASCVRGTSYSKKILLIGDSHAAMLNLAADAISLHKDIAFEVISGSSCLPFEGFDYQGLPAWARKPCAEQIKYVKQHIGHYDHVVVAAKWSFHVMNQRSMDSLKSFIGNGVGSGKNFLILGQVPEMRVNPRRANRLLNWGFEVPVSLDERFMDANRIVMNEVSGFGDVIFLNPTDLPLFKDAPYFSGVLGYHDSHHLNEFGARIYGGGLVDIISEFLTKHQHYGPVASHATYQ
jgi:hypothetical protein